MAADSERGVKFAVPPPLLYLGVIVAGVAIDLVVPLPVAPMAVALAAGAVLAALGLAIFGWAVLTMRAAGESPEPNEPTRRIVDGGPYRFSRNPIYVGMTLVAAGVALLVNSGWGLALLVPALAMMHYGVITREERYLDARLGDDYRAYRRRVRRWV